MVALSAMVSAIRQLQYDRRRELQGDSHARLLPVGENSVDELIRAYNRLTDERRRRSGG